MGTKSEEAKLRYVGSLTEYKTVLPERFETFKENFIDGEYVDFLQNEYNFYRDIKKSVTVELLEDSEPNKITINLKSKYDFFDFVNEEGVINGTKLASMRLTCEKIIQYIEKLLNGEGWFYKTLLRGPSLSHGLFDSWVEKTPLGAEKTPLEIANLKERLFFLIETDVIDHLIEKYNLKWKSGPKKGKINANKLAELISPLLNENKVNIQPILNATINNPEDYSEKNLIYSKDHFKKNVENHLNKFV